MKTTETFFELTGWFGAIAFLVGYFLISTGSMEAQSIAYQGLVLLGALGIVVVSLYKKTYQTAVLNGVFAIIALTVVARILL